LLVTAGRPLRAAERKPFRRALGTILALDVDLRPFHAHCRRHKNLQWIARKKLGRFLRGEDLWEDMVKTLLTTNCTWPQTIAMVDRLVVAFHNEGGENPAFPSAETVATRGERFLATEVRVGYRARALRELAERAACGGLASLQTLDAEGFYQGVLAFRGFGDYAASSLLMLRGHHVRPVIDSWALARARELHFRGRRCSAAQVRRRYGHHGPHQALVTWFDLNREHYQRLPSDWV
jgi:3-methyladenine DNA glycosylase/8-oxoguanine DNA glycosylase